MRIIKKCVELYDGIKYKIWFKLVLKEMDDRWRYTGVDRSAWRLNIFGPVLLLVKFY